MDNYDSYSRILAALVEQAFGQPPIVVMNDSFHTWEALLEALPPFAAVIISPGPGSPDKAADFGLCASAYRSGLPLLGICLGPL